ncbi:ABC transporter permease subunit [Oscillospiraceae bacterium OttesenSCG-928-G22]|nr:ABC transporter permease subunit [Oscillospiraceae bacterium OttesenSCG-928-G22]
MTTSTSRNRIRKAAGGVAATLFWIAVWQFASDRIGQEILLVSPVSVVRTLFSLAAESAFWQTIWFSFSRIAAGFLLAIAAGIALSVLAFNLRVFRVLLSPLVATVKSIPVASFVILLLVWVSSENLAVPTSFLMVFPIAYTNLLEGLEATDRQLLEMADVFRVTPYRRVLYIYLSNVMPFFATACRLGLGLCFKAGVAAEVIGIPKNSIGAQLYQAKLYLETADLFAWTLVIIVMSVVFEKVFMTLVTRIVRWVRER